MIQLTRLNGSEFILNAEKIRTLEATPDTMIHCDGGEKFIVKEPLSEVVRRSIDFARRARRPLAD
ncbi:MAG: flagellar FlbD family protein [Planctomycetota bacterium]